MQRILLSLLAASLVLPSMALALDFTDLDNSNPNYTAIMSLVDQAILKGYDDGTFRPGQDVTRAETLKIVLLGAGIEVPETEVRSFSDVVTGDWFVDYVEEGFARGIVQGYEDGTYLPNQTVTRAEAMKIILTTTDVATEELTEAIYDDVQADDWFAPYAKYAMDWNIQGAQTDGLWHPHQDVTRGELAEMMYRFQQVQATQTVYDETGTWLNVQFPTVDITLDVPHTWFTKTDGVGAVWLLDEDNRQFSLLTPYANGGTLLMTRFSNPDGRSSSQLFADIKAQTPHAMQETSYNGNPTLIIQRDEDLYFREWYIYLQNERMVHLVAMRGQGAYSDELEYYLNEIVESVEFYSAGDSGMTADETAEEIRKGIQVDGVGTGLIELLPDATIIETDSIGIGTGPVDYYYSPSADITIKYERSFDVILDVKDGETTAF